MSAVDPGAKAPQRERHLGDEHAERIRAALERLRPEHRVAKTHTEAEEAAIEAVLRG